MISGRFQNILKCCLLCSEGLYFLNLIFRLTESIRILSLWKNKPVDLDRGLQQLRIFG